MDTQIIKFYSTEEIAEMLKISKRTVFRYIHAGTLHAVKIGKYWRVSQESLEAFLQEQKRT